nr:MAG TPA: hypothetical protein [Caudoviricetes sp.]
MFSNLKLSGNEAIVFAIVYGFSQDGKSWYRGGSYYIEQTTPFTQRTAKTHLWTLEKMGVIEMQKETVNGVDRNIYRATPGVEEMIFPDRKPTREQTDDPGKNFTRENFSPVKNTSENPGKIFTQTREKFSRKKSIEKSIGKSIYQREALKTDGLMDSETAVDEMRERFREQLELDTLALRYDPGELEELEEAIVDMYTCPEPYQQIGQQLQSTKAVRQMLDKLTSQHIEYIMESLSNTTQPIKNIRSYLRVTILRAPTTVEHYYKAQANAAVAKAPHPAGPSAEKLAATLRRIQKRGDGA